MARTYKRDANGRFAGGGGGGGKRGGGKKASGGKAFSGRKGKVGKATAGRTAKANYKAATSQARQAKMLAGGRTSTRGLGKRTDAGAKNIRTNVKAYQSAQAKVRKMEAKRSTAGKTRTATASKKGKAAGGAKARKPDFKPKRKGATAASTVSEQAALARLGSGRRLRGKGNNPTARAERVLERGLSGTGRRARKSEATAKRAIDYMASQGTLGKRGKRRKA